MEFRYPGQTHLWGGREIPCVASIDGKHFLRLEARCVGCGRDHLLLDADFHGWDGFVCHDPEQAALPRPDLVAWPCRDCAGLQHYLVVGISVENEELILEEAEDDIDPARWYDAFGWFAVDATCVRCGRIEQDLISYETM